jgi:hypothetical protein
MPSPFPGMNPYFEHDDAWQDFHNSFLFTARNVLTALVRPNYIVRAEQHVYLHDSVVEPPQLAGRPDLFVARPDRPEGAAGTGLLEAPTQVRLIFPDLERETYLEVRDRRTRKVVTVIELLSPSNKQPGHDREQYEVKRGVMLASQAHFVELDLLRGGPRMPFESLPSCDYYALVSRVEDRPDAGLWPIARRDRLPEIPIPLRAPDPPARLDLQEVLHRVYDEGGFEDFIYDTEPDPPLSPEDAAWARSLIPRR